MPEPGYFRIVYLPEKEILKEACVRLKDFLAHYAQF